MLTKLLRTPTVAPLDARTGVEWTAALASETTGALRVVPGNAGPKST